MIEPSNTEFLKDWTLSEYNEGTEDQLDYYINTDACKEGDKAYQYSHADKILSEMVIKHIVRRSDDMTVYDKMDADVLLEGKDHHNADTSAEFITDNDCYLVWFAYV